MKIGTSLAGSAVEQKLRRSFSACSAKASLNRTRKFSVSHSLKRIPHL